MSDRMSDAEFAAMFQALEAAQPTIPPEQMDAFCSSWEQVNGLPPTDGERWKIHDFLLQAAIDQNMIASVVLGETAVSGLDDNGQLTFRLTERGRKAAEEVVARFRFGQALRKPKS